MWSSRMNNGEIHSKVVICSKLEEFPVPIIRVSGTAKERGLEYGKAARELIHKSISINQKLLCSLRKKDVNEINQIAMEYKKAVRLYDNDALEEMQGIAEGAQVPFEDIITLNMKAELMNPYCESTGLGCTTVAINNENEFSVGQTFDWFCICKKLFVILYFKEDSHEGFMIAEAGCIGGIGMNNRGIVVLLNYLNNFYIQKEGVSYNCLLRRVLLSDNFTDVQRNLLRSPIAYGLNMLIASKRGECIDFELTSKGTDFYNLTNGGKDYVHTNHYLSSKLKTRVISKAILEESKGRYDEAITYLKNSNDNRERLNICFTRHQENTPVCRHGNDEEDSVETLFAVSFDMMEDVLSFKFGLPCSSKEYKLSFDKLFNHLNF